MTTSSSTRPALSRRRLATATFTIAVGLAVAGFPGALGNDVNATTTNETPVIAGVYFYTADPTSGSGATCKATGRATTLNPTAGSTTTVHVCVEATDGNGYEDVCDSGATSSSDVRTFSVTDSSDVSISDASHPKTNVALTCATGSGTAVALVGSFEMEYWRPPVSGGSSNKVTPTITDVAAASATAVTGTFAYASLTSLDSATAGAVNLGGAFAPGDTGTEVAVALYNKGNAAFTIHLAGTALTGTDRAQTIAAGNLKWATSSSVAYASKTAVTGSSTSTGLSASPESADGTTAHNVYLQLAVPAGSAQWVPADAWAGTVTFATS